MEAYKHVIAGINISTYYDTTRTFNKTIYTTTHIYVVYLHRQSEPVKVFSASLDVYRFEDKHKAFYLAKDLVEAKIVAYLIEHYKPLYVGDKLKINYFGIKGTRSHLSRNSYKKCQIESHSFNVNSYIPGKYSAQYIIVLKYHGDEDVYILIGKSESYIKSRAVLWAKMDALSKFESDVVEHVCSVPGRLPNLSDNVNFDMTRINDDGSYTEIYPPIRTKNEEKMMHEVMDRELDDYFSR